MTHSHRANASVRALDDDREHRKRLLMVTSTFPGHPEDGTPSFVLDLAQGLAPSFAITVIAPRSRSASYVWPDIEVSRFGYFLKSLEGLADGAIMPNLRANRLRWTEVPSLLGAMALKTVSEAKRQNAAVVNAHWIIPAGLAAWINWMRNGTPYIVTAHGADVHTLRRPPLLNLKRVILENAQRIVPVSASIHASLTSLSDTVREKLAEPVPMGVPPITEGIRVKRRSATYVFVGRLAEKKGVTVALRALAQTDPDVNLRVIGDGPQMGEARALVRDLGLADRVLFLGRLGRPRVIAELLSSSGILIPSRVGADGDQDGTPVVLAEAFATGTPVIASALGGLQEHVVDGVNGVLVPKEDDVKLAHAMVQGVQNPDWFRSLGLAALKCFDGSPLDMRVTARRYEAIIDSATEDRG